ncbi:MAG: metallophosphoesterase [Candidatus Zixiibacteriota bacterium]
MKKMIFSVLFTLIFSVILSSASPLLILTACASEKTPAPIRFAVMGDRTSGIVPGVYDTIIEEVQILRPDFVITVGDMIDGYVDDTLVMNRKWEEFTGIVEPLSMPIYYTPGNNDIFSDLSEAWYPGHIGRRFYSFDYNGLHFIILDNSRVETSTELPAGQMAWLTKDLTDHQNAAYTFVFMHKPFWYLTTAENKPDTLHTLFVTYGVDAVFTGHYHDYFSGEYDGIKYTSMGSSGGGTRISPTGLEYHFGWVTVDADGIHIGLIDKGSVRPREETTAADRKIYFPLRQAGLTMETPVEVAANLTVTDAAGEIILHNSYSDQPLNDTLRWEVPDNWTVTPSVMPVSAAAGEDKSVAFNATCTGQLYPLPQASVKFNYAEGKKVEAGSMLYLARSAACRPVTGQITLDGNANEPCWQNPETIFYNENDQAKIDATEFYFTHDRINLYIFARCFDAVMDSLKAVVTEQDGVVYTEDCIGFFISPANSYDTVYQIYFNPLGAVYDHKLFQTPDNEWDYVRGWNGRYEIGSSQDTGSWSLEIKIPASQLGLDKIKDGEKWRVNFRRKQPRLKTAGDWQPPIGYPDYRSGYLIME